MRPGAPEIGSNRQMTDFSGVPYQGKVEQTCDRAPFLQGEYPTLAQIPVQFFPVGKAAGQGEKLDCKKACTEESASGAGVERGRAGSPRLSRGAGETKPLQHRDKALGGQIGDGLPKSCVPWGRKATSVTVGRGSSAPRGTVRSPR